MDLRLLTANVSADFLSPARVPAWDARKALFAQTVRAAAPHVIGFQELTPSQHTFWRAELPDYAVVALPGADPDPALLPAWRAKYARYGAETLPDPYELALFYRREMFEKLDTGHWWLSPTPDRPSTGFGNTAPRAVLWVRLRVRGTQTVFHVFNTHIDWRCITFMLAVCHEQLAPFIAPGDPLFWVGDFNFSPQHRAYSQLIVNGWHDAHDVRDGENHPTFLYDQLDVPAGRIDHILYRGPGVTPQAWRRLLSPEPAVRLSDHDPVLAGFTIRF